MAWAPGARHVAIGCSDAALRVYDAETLKAVRSFEGVHQERCGVLECSLSQATLEQSDKRAG